MTNLKNNKKIVSIFSPSLQKLLLFSLIILIWATYWKIRFQDKRKGRSISVKHHCSEDFVKLTSRLGSHFKLGFAPLQSTVGSWNHEILSAKQLQLLFIWQTQLISFRVHSSAIRFKRMFWSEIYTPNEGSSSPSKPMRTSAHT